MIKSGLQFTNIIEQDYVIKRVNSLLKVVKTNRKWYANIRNKPLKLIKKSIADRKYTFSQFNLLRQHPEFHYLFCITQFKKHEIIQKRLIPLVDLLDKENPELQVLDKFFSFQFELWQKGLFETTFEFRHNYGIDKKGKMFLIDVGEFCFEKQKLIDYINKTEWLKKYSFRVSNKKVQDYFKKKAKSVYTINNVEKFWNTKPL